MPARDTRIELKRGSATAVVHWPVVSASSCAAWLREQLLSTLASRHRWPRPRRM